MIYCEHQYESHVQVVLHRLFCEELNTSGIDQETLQAGLSRVFRVSKLRLFDLGRGPI